MTVVIFWASIALIITAASSQGTAGGAAA